MTRVAVNIVGNVDNQIDVDSESSSDNEPLEEVVSVSLLMGIKLNDGFTVNYTYRIVYYLDAN